MILRNFYDDSLAEASYLVGCAASGEAIVIDPLRDPDFYLDAAARQHLRIVAVAETHIHADYLSGGRELAARSGAKLYVSDEGGPDWLCDFRGEDNVVPMKDGHVVRVGNLSLRAIHTPGHTPEHMAFLLTDHATSERPHSLFSGDLLFVGDVGRPDLLERAAAIVGTMEKGARQLYRSLQALEVFDDALLVWPGHGAGSACGKALGGSPVTTLGYERATSWAFRVDSENKFVDEVLAGQPDPPLYFAMMKTLNKKGAPIRTQRPSVTPAKAAVGQLIDTRSFDELRNGFVPGAIAMPLSKGFVGWAGWLVAYDAPITLVATSQAKADEAAALLGLIGLDEVVGWIPPTSLVEVPVVRATEVQPEDAILDVRGPGEWAAVHVPRATHIPLGHLPRRLDEVPKGKRLVVHCASGGRSPVAVSILLRAGFENVVELAGGIDEIIAERSDLVASI